MAARVNRNAAPGFFIGYNLGMTSLSNLPGIDALLRAGDHLVAQYGHDQTVRALRRVVETARQ
jgi:hypothetical protein